MDITGCCKYVQIVMTAANKHVTTIFDDSMHALNVSCNITLVILFRHLIRVNCILFMAPDPIWQVSDVLIYLDVIVLNITRTIRQALTTFPKLVTYGE